MHTLAPLAVALSLSSAAAAETPLEVDACTSGQSYEIYVADELQPRCDVLFGDLDVRDANYDWRTARIMAVESGSRTLDVMHKDAQLKRPQLRALAGMTVTDIFRADVVEEQCDAAAPDVHADDPGAAGDEAPLASAEELADVAATDAVVERVARVELSAPWSELCGQEEIILRVDDAIGASGRVVHIDRRGVLAYLGGGLVWLGKSGAETPVFRTTWQSDFSVITTSDHKPTPKKRRRARRSRRRR